MATVIQDKIKEDFKELIKLISLIGDRMDIEEKYHHNSIILHIYNEGKKLLIFKLSLSSIDNSFLDVSWKIPNSIDYISAHCFPRDFRRKTIFNKLSEDITKWQLQVANSGIKESLAKVVHQENTLSRYIK